MIAKYSHKDEECAVLFDRVGVSINNETILEDISCNLTQKRIAVFGNNGSGKSTFARCAIGAPSLHDSYNITGTISIHGMSLRKLRRHIWKHINMTFQIPDQQIVMPSVEEELRVGLKNSGLDSDSIKEKVDYALEILKLKPTQPCYSISAGKKRLLCLMSILLIEPKTIILDEPTTFLDMPTKIMFMNFIDQLSQQIIFITHDFFLVESYQYALCFHQGKLEGTGTVSDTLREYKKVW